MSSGYAGLNSTPKGFEEGGYDLSLDTLDTFTLPE
jgi:hypothetical protein